jgi:hypothetical protein
VYKEGEDGSSESQLVGIITLEDVIEELIGKEIVDETDVYVDVHKRIAVARARLQYQRQSVSAPASCRPSISRAHHKWQRSMSHESQISPAKELVRGDTQSPPGRVLSVVAEVEPDKSEESTQWEAHDDTIPLL